MRSALAAVAFLTRLPVGRMIALDSSDVSRSAGWFPLVGALLGIIYYWAGTFLRPHLPLLLVAALLVALDAALTGGLHFDGLADTADGFGGGKTHDDVLRIMRDHAIGSYGGVALALVIVLKTAAYQSLLERDDWMAFAVLTPVLGRWSMLLLIRALSYARTSTSVISGMGTVALLLGTAATLAMLFAFRMPVAWTAAGVTLAVAAAFGLYCRHRIGGITGDTLGANLEICECAALLVFLWS